MVSHLLKCGAEVNAADRVSLFVVYQCVEYLWLVEFYGFFQTLTGTSSS